MSLDTQWTILKGVLLILSPAIAAFGFYFIQGFIAAKTAKTPDEIKRVMHPRDKGLRKLRDSIYGAEGSWDNVEWVKSESEESETEAA